jgi:hypothetical protein
MQEGVSALLDGEPEHATQAGRSRWSKPLLVVNAALVSVLAGLYMAQPTSAQVGGQFGNQVGVPPTEIRARGEYTMVSGRVTQGSIPVVYVVDSANGEVIALRWDNNKQSFAGVGYRNMLQDARAARGR